MFFDEKNSALLTARNDAPYPNKFLLVKPNKAVAETGWPTYDIDQIENNPNVGMLVDKGYVVVDADHHAHVLLRLIKDMGLKVRIMQTNRGYHFWFRSKTPMKNYVGMNTPIGLIIDIRSWGDKKAMVIVKWEGTWRKWVNDTPWDELDEIPFWLLEMKHSYQFADKKEGSRNHELFKYQIELSKNRFTYEQSVQISSIINDFVFQEPLPQSELLSICRREAWPKGEEPFTTGDANHNGENAIGFKLKCFDDVVSQTVKWLWYPYIPRGKIILVQGDPGCGKTFFASAITSIVSNGQAFPGQFIGDTPANVVFQNGEDGIADTLKPRLEKAGANQKRVFIIDETECQVGLSNITAWRQIFEDLKPALLIIDPLQQYLGHDVDMHRANEVRPIMAGFAKLAEEFETAVVILMHMNKGGAQKAMYRALGSIDLPAISRSILMIGEDPDNQGIRHIVHVKSSLAPKGASQAFEISIDGGFVWKGESSATSEDLLASKKDTNSVDDSSALGIAMNFIRDRLTNGPVASKSLEQEARDAGIAQRTLIRARERLQDQKEIMSKKWSWGWGWQQTTKASQEGEQNNVDTQTCSNKIKILDNLF